MRKFFGYAIIVSLLFSSLTLCEAKPKKTKKPVITTKHKVEFTTRDKFILVGDMFLAQPETDKPLVVFLHSYATNAQVWKDIAESLRKKGYNVLTMDLRGHGRSVYNNKLKLKSRYYFTNADWKKLTADIVDSVRYIKTQYPKVNTDDVILVGADIGAQAAANAALSLKKTPEKLILISPMLEFKGIEMPIKTHKFKNTKIFMMMSKTDRLLFHFDTKIPPIIKYYPNGGPGVQLIKLNKETPTDIIDFIAK